MAAAVLSMEAVGMFDKSSGGIASSICRFSSKSGDYD